MLLGALLALSLPAAAQEVRITDFPIGVGQDVGPEFFAPYHDQLQAIADTLHKYPLARAVIVGGADGYRYATDNDAKNPGLSLGRAHALRNVLVHECGADSTQLFIQSNDVVEPGGEHRYATVRIAWELMQLNRRTDTVVVMSDPPPPAPTQITQYIADHMGLRFSAGGSTTAFGGLPMIAGAVTWRKIVFAEAMFGHTFWNGSYTFESSDLDTWRRMSAARLTIYPWEDKPVGFTGGWMRAEEISQKHYKYVKLSEGPFVGVEVTPFDHVSLLGAYNPARHRTAGQEFSRARNGQFLVSLFLHTDLGGNR
jgi:hypothetical protein